MDDLFDYRFVIYLRNREENRISVIRKLSREEA